MEDRMGNAERRLISIDGDPEDRKDDGGRLGKLEEIIKNQNIRLNNHDKLASRFQMMLWLTAIAAASSGGTVAVRAIKELVGVLAK
jgi:hypothetical protein